MRKTRIAVAASLGGLTAVGLGQAGCSSDGHFHAPHVSRIFSPRPVAENPLVVPSSDFDTVWNKTVAVVDKYFDIASENRLSRTIVTQPKIGATLLEPWSGDSVGFTERLESSLQTIRRFAIIKVDPAPTGGYLVKVEVRKELEDLVKPDRQAAVARCSTTTSRSTGRERLSVPSPRLLGGFREDETRTWSKPSWPASVMRFFFESNPRSRASVPSPRSLEDPGRHDGSGDHDWPRLRLRARATPRWPHLTCSSGAFLGEARLITTLRPQFSPSTMVDGQ